jgi:hypothetical protein
MNHGPMNPFEPLEPPRGGLAGLRTRIELDDRRRTRRRRRWAMATAASIPAAFLVLMLVFGLQPQAPMPEGIRWARIAAGLDAGPVEPLTITRERNHLIAAQRIPTDSDDVVFYLVGSLQTPSRLAQSFGPTSGARWPDHRRSRTPVP